MCLLIVIALKLSTVDVFLASLTHRARNYGELPPILLPRLGNTKRNRNSPSAKQPTIHASLFHYIQQKLLTKQSCRWLRNKLYFIVSSPTPKLPELQTISQAYICFLLGIFSVYVALISESSEHVMSINHVVSV